MKNLSNQDYSQVVSNVLANMTPDLPESSVKGIKTLFEGLVSYMMNWSDETKISFIDNKTKLDDVNDLMTYMIPSNLLKCDKGQDIYQAIKHGLAEVMVEVDGGYMSLVKTCPVITGRRSNVKDVTIVFNEMVAAKLLQEAQKLKGAVS
jgi:hypothetical protein